jgi:glucose-6-phosphate isomerase
MSIKVNFDYIAKEDLVDFKASAAKVKEIDSVIKNKTGLGNGFLGWLDWPTNYSKEEVARIKKKSSDFIANYDTLVVCGIGGSYLGARAAIEALTGQYGSKMEIIYLGNTLDPNYIDETIEHLKTKKFAICVISKSGTTTETSVSFRILKEILEEKYGKDYARKSIVAVTDKAKGALKTLATKEGYETYVLPDDIGGRYSVLTAVGLFPIACAGIDIEFLLKGAKEAQKQYDDPNIETNDAYKYALERNYLYQKGYKVEMFASYEPRLKMINEWRKQLFDESEGKDGKAVLTDSVTFTTDLHSLGQFIQEGSKILYETVLWIDQPTTEVTVPSDKEDLDGLNYLADKPLSYINHKAYIGTLQAHSLTAKVPNICINISKMDAEELGRLFYFFMKACAMSAYLLGVNPFNQPGVEVYKKNMFHLLGKKGY